MESFDEREEINDLPVVRKMPDWLYWTTAFINRVGFPIFAFIVICYVCFIKLGALEGILGKLNTTIETNNILLTQVLKVNK